MLSLLLDDEQGLNNQDIWNAYYHLYLNIASLELVQSQARKLYVLSVSIQSWHDCKYGKFLRVCAQKTLDELRNIWKAYDNSDLSEKEQETYDQCFKLGIKKCVDIRTEKLGGDIIMTGCRSAAPTIVESMDDMPKLHQHFWDHGITDKNPEFLSHAKHSNPMFASLLTDTFILHYGSDPLLGFHLATAYVPLVLGSPLYHSSSKKGRLQTVVDSARAEFRAWGEKFRERAGHNLTLRFFAGDALAFCYTLQHMAATGDNCANWYRRQYTFEPLFLDSQDYDTKDNAPLTFNVIDTSNLTDHLGALNVLMATTSLLDRSLSATLNMETLVHQAKDHQALVESLVCGDLATISILFGLFPVEYWTNATATSTAFLDITSHSGKDKESEMRQMYKRITWKWPNSASVENFRTVSTPSVHFNEAELTTLLYKIYLKMFQHEDMSSMFSNPDILMLKMQSLPVYHRATFAAFLSCVKRRVVVSNWNNVMGALLPLIENDQNLILGRNYLQELYLQLHIFNVYSTHVFQPAFNVRNSTSGWKGISAWENIPAVVCITLKVPRSRLKVFMDLPLNILSTPPVQCLMQSSNAPFPGSWQNIFAAVQLSFGKISTLGSQNDRDFSVNVLEDGLGWEGSSPLLVSFFVPSWTILQEEQTTVVAFGVQITPQSIRAFSKTLGVGLEVYKTVLANEDNVFITRNRPNQKGFPSIGSFLNHGKGNSDISRDFTRSVMTANLNSNTSRITTITGRFNLLTDDHKSALRDGCQVETVQVSPCIIGITFDKMKQQCLHFPAPVLQARSKCRIARKSMYVEVETPVARPLGDGRIVHFISPTFENGRDPVIWNMPRLNLDCLPEIDATKTKGLEWLKTHAIFMWSSRERKLRDISTHSSTAQKDVRVGFKDSLFSMFMHYAGVEGRKEKIFGISNSKSGGVQIIFFVSCLRLDLSNRTVVLDAVALPLSIQIMPTIITFLSALTDRGFGSIEVGDEELKMWKEMLPAYVERCRRWKHHPTCEYSKASRIPLSVEFGHQIICSCGKNTIPKGLFSDIPHWNTISKHCVRVAISPLFSPPFVEPVYDGSNLDQPSGNGCATCGKKESPGNGTKMQKCARCLKVKYCSVECQRAAWKTHKKNCAK